MMQPLLQWKSVSTTYSKIVFVALHIQHAMHMLYIDVRGMSNFTKYFHFISETTLYSKKRY